MNEPSKFELFKVWLAGGVGIFANITLSQFNTFLTTAILLGTVIYTWRKALRRYNKSICDPCSRGKIPAFCPLEKKPANCPNASPANRKKKRFWNILHIVLFAVLVLLLLSPVGCATPRVAPGHSNVVADGVSAEVVQSQDPKTSTTQTITIDTAAAGPATGSAFGAPNMNLWGTNALAAASALPAGPFLGPVSFNTHKEIRTVIGPAQKNTIGEMVAKLGSIRWLQWLGVALLLLGGATMFYPPARLLVNSTTTSVFIMACGAAFIVGPLLIIGHEGLIIGIGAGIALLWFLAHRHGSVSGELKALKSYFVAPTPAAPAEPAAPAPPAPGSAAPGS